MGDVRSTIDEPSRNGRDSFLPPPALRTPTGGLGPRAQRTIARIVDATRDVFLSHGYGGTTIDEIARVANVSRASFYTYFPSKREVLLAVGEQATAEGLVAIRELPEAGATRARLSEWVARYFDYLDIHGGLSMAWTQAARADPEIRDAGMKRHLGLCREFGRRLAASAGRSTDRPAVLGLVASSVLERSWSYSDFYADTIKRTDMIEQCALALWGVARQSSSAVVTAS